MRKALTVSLALAFLACSCDKREYTNWLSGTVWEGTEIDRTFEIIWGEPDTIRHRLEFLEWSDRHVKHFSFPDYYDDWFREGLFEYNISGSGTSIRMGWEIGRFSDDTLSRRLTISDDRMYMTGDGIELTRVL